MLPKYHNLPPCRFYLIHVLLKYYNLPPRRLCLSHVLLLLRILNSQHNPSLKMFSSVLAWVQTHILYFLYQAANAPENGLITLLSGSGLDLTHLHRFNREFWSLLQIVPDGMTTNPYHGTMVASMPIFPDLTYLPPTGRFEAMLESLVLNPLLHLCYGQYSCISWKSISNLKQSSASARS